MYSHLFRHSVNEDDVLQFVVGSFTESKGRIFSVSRMHLLAVSPVVKRAGEDGQDIVTLLEDILAYTEWLPFDAYLYWMHYNDLPGQQAANPDCYVQLAHLDLIAEELESTVLQNLLVNRLLELLEQPGGESSFFDSFGELYVYCSYDSGLFRLSMDLFVWKYSLSLMDSFFDEVADITFEDDLTGTVQRHTGLVLNEEFKSILPEIRETRRPPYETDVTVYYKDPETGDWPTRTLSQPVASLDQMLGNTTTVDSQATNARIERWLEDSSP